MTLPPQLLDDRAVEDDVPAAASEGEEEFAGEDDPPSLDDELLGARDELRDELLAALEELELEETGGLVDSQPSVRSRLRS